MAWLNPISMSAPVAAILLTTPPNLGARFTVPTTQPSEKEVVTLRSQPILSLFLFESRLSISSRTWRQCGSKDGRICWRHGSRHFGNDQQSWKDSPSEISNTSLALGIKTPPEKSIFKSQCLKSIQINISFCSIPFSTCHNISHSLFTWKVLQPPARTLPHVDHWSGVTLADFATMPEMHRFKNTSIAPS